MVSWVDADGVYRTASRGDEVPSDVPADRLKAWQDSEVFGPHGAVAKAGSPLAELGSSGVSIALDPAEARRRFQEAAGEDVVLTDPAGRNNGVPQSSVDPSVASEAERAARLVLEGTTAGTVDLDELSKADLQTMADGLGVEYVKRDSADKLRAAIREHMAAPPADETSEDETPAGEDPEADATTED